MDCQKQTNLRGQAYFHSLARAAVWVSIKTTSCLKIGNMRNCLEDLLITHKLKIPRLPPKANSIVEVRWNLPPTGWLKCNIDGSALGAPGLSGCGGIFRTCRGFSKGCFSFFIGVGHAFEAELLGFILAVEKAKEFEWRNLWIESDSSYVVNLFRKKSGKIPWKLNNRWHRAMKFASEINVVVSHIFREGNAVADKLSNLATKRQQSMWWRQFPNEVSSLIYRDIVPLPHYRFGM